MAKPREPPTRLRLAQEAARLIAEGGIHDYAAARRKAAERLGVAERRLLPDPGEIEAALREYQRLFRPQQGETLKRLRQEALQAMRLFARFEPRLVGPILDGSADAESKIYLHLFADQAEEVALFLADRAIPFRHDERRVRMGDGRRLTYPLYRFVAGDTAVELTVYPPAAIREPPLSPLDGKPMRRAKTAAVERLLADEFGYS